MQLLTDSQRVELAIPAYLFYALTRMPGAFVPADPDMAAKAEADITSLSADLQVACVEPFSDLTGKKQRALLHRVERVGKGVISQWSDWSILSVMLALWYFLADLTDREILILWQGSAMERATSKLLPMFVHGFGEETRDAAAHELACQLLARLQAEGLFG